VVNRERQIVLRNAAAARMLSNGAAEPLPSPLAGLACEKLRDLVAEVLDARTGPMIVSREVRVGKSTYMVNASPVFEPGGPEPSRMGGESLGAVAVLRDITALKRLEVAKSMFVSMVAHEIKSPIAAIEGYLQVILSGVAGSDPARDRKMMERALLRGQTLRSLVNELLNLTAIETGDFIVKRSPVDIEEVVDQAIDACREKAEAKGITVAARFADERPCPPVLADKDAMLSVFTNLIDNAVKYTPEGGHVDIAVRCDGLYVKVSVADDGIGMTAEDKERVFDEFFRAKNEYTDHVPGTGLGLTLARRLVEIHEGHIAVDSTPGAGSTFSVSIPVAETRGELEARP